MCTCKASSYTDLCSISELVGLLEYVIISQYLSIALNTAAVTALWVIKSPCVSDGYLDYVYWVIDLLLLSFQIIIVQCEGDGSTTLVNQCTIQNIIQD